MCMIVASSPKTRESDNTTILLYYVYLAHSSLLLLSTGVFLSLVQNIVFQLDEEDMDSFVLVVGQKKALLKMQKEYEDLVSL